VSPSIYVPVGQTSRFDSRFYEMNKIQPLESPKRHPMP
jgi:hypothetical protein